MSGQRCESDVLLLAVSGALEASEERRLREHLTVCSSCASEMDVLRELTADLSRLPTPMPPSGLVERVRRVVHLDLAGRADERLNRLVLVFLLLFSWTLTLVGFAAVRLLSGESGELLSLVHGASLSWSVAYFSAAWFGGAMALILIGLHRSKSRRSA